MHRTAWSTDLAVSDDAPVGIVVVNYNTRDLIAHLIYSLYRFVRAPRFHLVVVDNASTDGSAAFLAAVAETGIAEVVHNRTQRYHGPGLTQAMDYLARRQVTIAPPERLRAVWVLDSDCVVVRDDTLAAAMATMQATGAGIVGQWVYDDWHQGDMMGLHSLLIDPALVWQAGIAPFQEHGNPSEALQRDAARAGIVMAEFPFTREGYVIHVGRGTLNAVAHGEEQANRYFAWAAGHHAPHFMLEPDAPARYAQSLADFRADVGEEITAASLIAACAKYR